MINMYQRELREVAALFAQLHQQRQQSPGIHAAAVGQPQPGNRENIAQRLFELRDQCRAVSHGSQRKSSDGAVGHQSVVAGFQQFFLRKRLKLLQLLENMRFNPAGTLVDVAVCAALRLRNSRVDNAQLFEHR